MTKDLVLCELSYLISNSTLCNLHLPFEFANWKSISFFNLDLCFLSQFAIHQNVHDLWVRSNFIDNIPGLILLLTELCVQLFYRFSTPSLEVGDRSLYVFQSLHLLQVLNVEDLLEEVKLTENKAYCDLVSYDVCRSYFLILE